MAYFDKIDTKDKAYILGYLFADGHCDINKRTVDLTLSIKDKFHLINIAKTIGFDETRIHDYITKPNPKTGKCYEYCRLNLSGELFDGLIKYIRPRKTFTGKIPKIENDLIPAMLLGIFDGDGSISVTGKSAEIGISLNKKACEKYKRLLVKLGLNKNKINICPDKNIWRIRIHTREIILELQKIFYNNSPSLYLLRKKERFDLLKSNNKIDA